MHYVFGLSVRARVRVRVRLGPGCHHRHHHRFFNKHSGQNATVTSNEQLINVFKKLSV